MRYRQQPHIPEFRFELTGEQQNETTQIQLGDFYCLHAGIHRRLLSNTTEGKHRRIHGRHRHHGQGQESDLPGGLIEVYRDQRRNLQGCGAVERLCQFEGRYQ